MFAHDKASSSTHPLAVSLIGGLKSGHICSLGRRWAAMPRWHGDSSPQRRIAEMQGISKVLQFTVVKERSGVSPPKFERLEELDFLRGSSGTERSLLKEFLQPPLLIASTLWLFNERKLLNVPRSHSAVQNDLKAESCKVNVPGFNQGIQERDAILIRHIEHVCIQKFENRHPHILVASIGEPAHQAEPALAL